MRSHDFGPLHLNGECDSCHEWRELFGFEDDEPGEWGYCETCSERIRHRKVEREKARKGHAA